MDKARHGLHERGIGLTKAQVDAQPCDAKNIRSAVGFVTRRPSAIAPAHLKVTGLRSENILPVLRAAQKHAAVGFIAQRLGKLQ